jgi:hypothetical protein
MPYFSSEGLADDLERAGTLCGVAPQDDLVGGDGVDRAVLERLHARRIGVVLLQLHAGVLVLDPLRRVEPETEQSFLLFCSDSAPVMSVLSARTSRLCPVIRYGPAKSTFSLRASLIE